MHFHEQLLQNTGASPITSGFDYRKAHNTLAQAFTLCKILNDFLANALVVLRYMLVNCHYGQGLAELAWVVGLVGCVVL